MRRKFIIERFIYFVYMYNSLLNCKIARHEQTASYSLPARKFINKRM